MKKLVCIVFLSLSAIMSFGQSIGVGTLTPDPSAAIEVSSVTQGMLVPRMTSEQRELISAPAIGLLVFDLTSGTFWFRDTNGWVELVPGGNIEVHRNGPDMIYMGMTDSVGIGTMDPEVKLQVKTSNDQYGISHTNGDVEVATFVSNTGSIFGGWIGTRSNHPFNLFAADGANQFTLLQNGNIGLGTTSPIEKLHVEGNSYFNGNILINGAPNNRLDIVHDVPRSGVHPDDRAMYITGDFGAASGGIEFRHANGTQGIGFGYNTIYAAGNTPDQDLGVAAKGTGGSLFLNTNAITRLFISGDGKTGIGTTTPGATLDVIRGTGPEGTTRFQGTTHNSHFNYSTMEHTFIRGGKAGSHVVLNDLAGHGNVGVGTGNPVQKLHVAGKVYVRDSIGIGISAPNAPLQFGNGIQNRKLVLFDSFNNDHQYYGFGINTAILRYQVAGTDKAHVFYAGTSETTSNELMRIRGNGNVGIGIIPNNQLDIHSGAARTGTHPSGLPLYVTGDIGDSYSGIEFRNNNGTEGIGFGYNTIYAAGSGVDQNLGLNAKGASGNLLFSVNGTEKMRITSSGRIGLGVDEPNAQLHFGGTDANRKIVLAEFWDNDHQFYGFGFNGTKMRYQVPAVNFDHVFYAGLDSIHSNELMSIKGTGDVDILGKLEIGYHRITNTVTVAPGALGVIDCNCPYGYVVLGGGYYTSSTALNVGQSEPIDTSTYKVQAWNTSAFDTHTLRASALCARLAN